MVVLDKVTDFILFLGQLTITAGLGESHVHCQSYNTFSFWLLYKVKVRSDEPRRPTRPELVPVSAA